MSLIQKLNEAYCTLAKLNPRPPAPEVSYVVKKDSIWVHECLFNLEPSIVRLSLDATYLLTDKDSFLDIVAWDWVDSWLWVKDKFDCENHAIAFKSHVDRYFGLNQVGIVIDYKAGHGYNLVVFPDGEVLLFEPQNDSLFMWDDIHAILYALKDAFVLI